MNLSTADIPERTYEGDVSGATYERELVRIMFAQPKLGGGLRSLVIITMTPIAVAQFLNMIDSLEKPSLAEIVANVKINPESLTDFPKTEPDQTAALRANVVAAAFSGQEACFDFYYASPFSAAAISSTSQLNLEPIVRINTHTSVSISLIARLREFAERFPPSAKMREKSHA